MGAVFLGRREDRELEMDVAVKLVHDRLASPLEWRRFRQERQLLADLKHPHIATLLDAGSTAEGQPYVIMENIQGRTIDAWSRAHQPSLAVLLRLFRKLISAVGFAHGKGVIHRDINPGNIMVTQAGEPKLLDFGNGINNHLPTSPAYLLRPYTYLLTCFPFSPWVNGRRTTPPPRLHNSKWKNPDPVPGPDSPVDAPIQADRG